ncbi:uncharacterized protein LOC124442195 [Xenia sp. Carnegie-2017]|uniref:uncharacterized protein LOC124442195 n=1 Tax=Xenia sp. Carnegie-2017 TaxID=2897299 RepID=UPI001F033883|nr:uncharacterized protein LOC124442195 [Xenia sp. Carnegie-2017]
MLVKAIKKFAIDHIVVTEDKILKTEFSSYEKFLKFVVTFDLRSLVIDGKIPFTTQRVIGTCVSVESIKERLNAFPAIIQNLPKILSAADELLHVGKMNGHE